MGSLGSGFGFKSTNSLTDDLGSRSWDLGLRDSVRFDMLGFEVHGAKNPLTPDPPAPGFRV